MTNFGNKLEQYVNGNLPACHHPIKAVDDNNFCHKCGKQLEISKNSGVNYVEHLLTRIATLEAENARLTAANENERRLADMAWNDNQAALKAQVKEIHTLKQALTDIRATTVMLGDPQGAWKAWRKCCEIAGEALK